MSNMQVHQSSTLEENFVFGSPPLLNGFTYNSCRAQQEGSTKVNQDCKYYETSEPDIMSYCHHPTKFGNSRSTYTGLPKMAGANSTSMLDSLNQLYLNGNRPYVDNSMKILEHTGLKMQHQQNFNNNNTLSNSPKNVELVFKKRKDLRVLKAVLSTERFRKVTMMFGGGDENGREIVDSVHNSLRKSNTGSVSCLFCHTESQVYENFPIVDGTLFLSPVKLSKNCIRFVDEKAGSNGPSASPTPERHMCFICVSCLEGKPNKLQCSTCHSPWNGSFFQVGTLYSYNILSAIPCCEARVKCKNCYKSIIDWNNGDASTLFFSHFSSSAVCPHCNVEDFHYVKPLDTLRKFNFC